MPISRGNSTLLENSRGLSSSLAQSNRRSEYLSLGLCGVLALAFAIMVPPLQINDEHGHFVRAYEISRGEFVARGTPELPAPVAAFVMRYPEAAERAHKYTPQEILRDLPAQAEPSPVEAEALPKNDRHHRFLAWAVIGSATYFPLVYLPASLGICTARALHLSPLAMMYAARIFGVLAFVAALAISFRLAPGYRAVMTGVALLPMTLHQAGGITGDLVTIAVAFVGFSLVLHAREHSAGRRYLLLVAVLFSAWGLCKFSVWALPLLFLIPVSAFPSRRAWLAYIGTVALCMAGVLAIWNGIDSANIAAFRAARLSSGIDVSANVRLAAAHPLTFARQLLGLMHSGYRSEAMQFIGVFGWTKFSLPFSVGLAYLLLLVLVAATEVSNKPFCGWERAVLLLVFLGGVAVIHAMLFVSDGTLCAGDPTRLCFDASAGVQGRYFLPLCLAGLVALRQTRFNVSSATLLALVMGAGTLQALAALAAIRAVFYL
jgi:uncharacterized membrane protein